MMNTSNISSLPPQSTCNRQEHVAETSNDGGQSVEQVADIFTSSLSLENIHIDEGYQDGYKDGLFRGKQDGYEVGLKHGFQVGEELGFYRGLVDVWTSAIHLDPSCFSARVIKTIKQMNELLDKYPILDPENEGVDEIMEGLRLKFRAVSATLGVNLEYSGYSKKSDAQDFEF